MLRVHNILYESACIIGYCTCWAVGKWFVCSVVLQVCVDFSEIVSCVHYTNASTFITWFDDNGLVIFEVFNVVFSFNVRLLWVFRYGVLMGVSSCSMRVKKSTKVGLSEGGGIQLDFLLKGGSLS